LTLRRSSRGDYCSY